MLASRALQRFGDVRLGPLVEAIDVVHMLTSLSVNAIGRKQTHIEEKEHDQDSGIDTQDRAFARMKKYVFVFGHKERTGKIRMASPDSYSSRQMTQVDALDPLTECL